MHPRPQTHAKRSLIQSGTALAMVIGALMNCPANAVPALPNTSSTIILHANATQAAQVGVIGPVDLSTQSGTASASGSIDYQPSSNIRVNADVNGSGLSSAYTFFEYFFSVVGPTNVSIPIIVFASAEVSQPIRAGSSNTVQLFLGTPQSVPLIASACNAGAGSPATVCGGLSASPSFSIASHHVVTSNELDNIQATIFVSANTLFGAPEDHQSGFLDPVIMIDPDFSRANEFQIIFSSGVGNVAAIAEPTTLALLGSGLFGLGMVRRRLGTCRLRA